MSKSPCPELRRDLLCYRSDAGGGQVVDLLLEAAHRFDADEWAAIESLTEKPGPAALMARLDGALLLENPTVESLRQQAWAARIRRRVVRPPLDETEGPWHLATDLPDWVSPMWRAAERWRRLAEDAAAGRTPLRLDGFVRSDRAHNVRDEAQAAQKTRMDNNYCNADCHDALDDDGAIGAWIGLLRCDAMRELIGAVLRLELPEGMMAKVWQLGPGDHVGPHADGVRYVATLCLGLSAGWTARHGGGIVFGEPSEARMEARTRWLPHLGDAMLFRPEAWRWHAVEPVAKDTRLTLTCQWIHG